MTYRQIVCKLTEKPLSRITCDSRVNSTSIIGFEQLGFEQHLGVLMDDHRRWYPADQHCLNQEPFQRTQQNSLYGTATTDSVHNAQGLLAVYPMASATPTNHGMLVKKNNSGH